MKKKNNINDIIFKGIEMEFHSGFDGDIEFIRTHGAKGDPYDSRVSTMSPLICKNGGDFFTVFNYTKEECIALLRKIDETCEAPGGRYDSCVPGRYYTTAVYFSLYLKDYKFTEELYFRMLEKDICSVAKAYDKNTVYGVIAAPGKSIGYNCNYGDKCVIDVYGRYPEQIMNVMKIKAMLRARDFNVKTDEFKDSIANLPYMLMTVNKSEYRNMLSEEELSRAYSMVPERKTTRISNTSISVSHADEMMLLAKSGCRGFLWRIPDYGLPKEYVVDVAVEYFKNKYRGGGKSFSYDIKEVSRLSDEGYLDYEEFVDKLPRKLQTAVLQAECDI